MVFPGHNGGAGTLVDFDNDGDLDICSTFFGMLRYDGFDMDMVDSRFDQYTASMYYSKRKFKQMGECVTPGASSNGYSDTGCAAAINTVDCGGNVLAWGDYGVHSQESTHCTLLSEHKRSRFAPIHLSFACTHLVLLARAHCPSCFCDPLLACTFHSLLFRTDGDGYVDLFVGNDKTKANALYHNENGSGDFTVVDSTSMPLLGADAIHTNQAGTTANACGAAWGDCDNDGDLDLFVINCRHR